MSDRFENVSQAKAYAKYRTACPEECLNETIKFIREKYNTPLSFAVDVGCGTGLSSRILCPYFQEVLGTDISQVQLDEAKNDTRNPINVKYLKSPAEDLPVDDHSVQLVSVSHALHWFDLERFWPEVKRVLLPNGVLVVWRDCVSRIIVSDPEKTEELSLLYNNFRYETPRIYWDARNHFESRWYQNVTFPFQEVKRIGNLMHQISTTMKKQIEWYHSWSPYQKMKEQNPELAEKKLKELSERSIEILGTLDFPIITEMKGELTLCRD